MLNLRHTDIKTNLRRKTLKLIYYTIRPLLAMAITLAPLTAFGQNTKSGSGALNSNTTGNYNAAFGYHSLYSNTSGSTNVANGIYALASNTTGDSNIANGSLSLYSNTTGSWNTVNGYSALYYNTTGNCNTATGVQALYSNTTGNYNTTGGAYSLLSNTTGGFNTANGDHALYANSTGSYNTVSGCQALMSSGTGSYNTAQGFAALRNSTGSNNIAIGYQSGWNLTTGSNNINIGNQGIAGESNTIRIGTGGTHTSTFLAGVNKVSVSGGVAVYINSAGQLGTVLSSRRYKENIRDMGRVSESLMALRPVTFRYKASVEKGARPTQYGLIAEEVAKIAPDLVQWDAQGHPQTVYYHLLTPMLINELQKERAARLSDKREMATLKAELAALKSVQSKQLAELAKQVAVLQAAQQKGKTALAGLH